MYEVIVEAGVAKGLRRLPADVVSRVARQLRGLTADARPPGCRKLSESENAYRIRVGDYRIVYEVEDARRRVLVQAIGHRKDIYR